MYMKIVEIFTDGACSGNQNESNIGGWGCVLRYGRSEKELCGGERDTTNNRMELTALIEGLRALKEEGLSLRIFSDSSYLVNCFRGKWYASWEKNGWKTAGKKPVENRELWLELLSLIRKHADFEFFLVKGHLNPDWPDERLEPHYKKFREHNGDLSFEQFKDAVAMNVRCDALANVFINENR